LTRRKQKRICKKPLRFAKGEEEYPVYVPGDFNEGLFMERVTVKFYFNPAQKNAEGN
jgi:hypothetical protein